MWLASWPVIVWRPTWRSMGWRGGMGRGFSRACKSCGPFRRIYCGSKALSGCAGDFSGSAASEWLCWLVNSFLCVELAWRVTRWKIGALVAALLTPALPIFNWRGTTPNYWLAWYPVHHDLLMIGCLLAALLAFDNWLENGVRKYLLWTWSAFLLGALSKEFLYIFPLMAAALLKPRRMENLNAVESKRAWKQVVLMLAAVVLLYGYRYLVLPDPYNPQPLRLVHLIKRPFLYWLFPFYDTVLIEIWWLPGLALLLLLFGKGLLLWKQSRHAHWLARPFVGIAVGLAMLSIVGLHSELTYPPGMFHAFWYLLGPRYYGINPNPSALCSMIFAWYALYLLWKYRRSEPTLNVVLLVMLSYVPVFTYLGWHYTLTGWFVRTAFLWPLLAKLVCLNLDVPRRWNAFVEPRLVPLRERTIAPITQKRPASTCTANARHISRARPLK